MTGITSISAITTSAPVAPAVVASAPTPVPVQPKQTTPSRFEADPLSGVLVTQFLNESGDVVTQVPSKTVVAYLQNGLTPQGFAKEQPHKTAVA